MPKPKPRTKKRNEEMEREWLLLGEPASPRNTIILDSEQDTPTGPDNTTNLDAEQLQSPTRNEMIESSSESDSSTDIDAVVDEYRQKVEFTTSGPTEKVLRIPSAESWRLSMVLLSFYFISVCICVGALAIGSGIIFAGGVVGELFHKIPNSGSRKC